MIPLAVALTWFLFLTSFSPTHSPRPLPPRRAEEGANRHIWPRPLRWEINARLRAGLKVTVTHEQTDPII